MRDSVKKRFLIIVVVCLFVVARTWGEPASRSFVAIQGGLCLPMGQYESLYGTGASAELFGQYGLGSAAALRGTFSYTGVPVGGDDIFSLLSVGAGPTIGFDVLRWLRLEARGMGGYYYASLMSDSAVYGYNPCWEGGLAMTARLTPSFSVGLDASYRSFISFTDDLKFSANATLRLGSSGSDEARKRLAIQSTDLGDIYPLFYKYYDEHAFGSITVSNPGDRPIDGIRVSVFIKDYMTNPKVVDVPGPIKPGKSGTIDLYGLFSRSILSVSETTKASVEIIMTYTVDGQERSETRYESIRIFDRNALTWDDDRKAAAFVSSKDPTVSKFARNALSAVSGSYETALDKNMLAAIAVHKALCLYGIAYSSAPVAALLSKDESVVDSVQYPAQTMDFKSGNCSDLSVLYASAIEALGIETALITVPGHIFPAIALNASPSETASFARSDDLIVAAGRLWLPIEATMRDGDFMGAWAEAAREWRDAGSRAEAAIYPVHDAWKVYEAVGFSASGDPLPVPAPDTGEMLRRYRAELERIALAEIGPREARLKAEAAKADASPRTHNSLGVLYARYGLLDKAEAAFLAAIAKDRYNTALVNLGNVRYVQARYDEAADLLAEARSVDPANPAILVAYSRAALAAGDRAASEEAYAALVAADPGLASRYSYLGKPADGSPRASESIGASGPMEWME